MVFQTKTYATLVSASPKSISDKRAAKKRKSRANIVFLDIGTTVRHTFLSSELQCLPHGDPRNLCVNTRIRLLATHPLSLSSIPDKPENIHLMSSAVDNKVCTGEVISFNCSANANPGVTSYQLFENETAIFKHKCRGDVEQDFGKWRSVCLQMCGQQLFRIRIQHECFCHREWYAN